MNWALSKTKKNFLFWLTIIYILVGGGIHLILKIFFPDHLFPMYPLLPLFFYLFGWYYIYAFELCRRYKPHRMMLLYMGMKFVKMVLAIFVVLYYILVLKVEPLVFFVCFLIFYFFSIFYETYFFYRYEYNKQMKDKLT